MWLWVAATSPSGGKRDRWGGSPLFLVRVEGVVRDSMGKSRC